MTTVDTNKVAMPPVETIKRCFKVAVVGDAKVGKRSAIRAFAGKPYEAGLSPDGLDMSSEEEYSDAHIYQQVQVEEVELADPLSNAGSPNSSGRSESRPNITAQFWHCSSNSINAKAIQSIYRDAMCVLILYDITSYRSFQHATTQHYEQALQFAPDAFIILVGCKADLAHKRLVDLGETESFTSTHDLSFREISAKSGSNVDLVLVVLCFRAKHFLSAHYTPRRRAPGLDTFDSRKHILLNGNSRSSNSEIVSSVVEADQFRKNEDALPLHVLAGSPHRKKHISFSTQNGQISEEADNSRTSERSRSIQLSAKSPVLTVSDILNQHSGGGGGETVTAGLKSWKGVGQSGGSDGENRDVISERPKRELNRNASADAVPMSQEYEHLKLLFENTIGVSPTSATAVTFNSDAKSNKKKLEKYSDINFDSDNEDDEEIEVLTIPGGAGPTTLRLHRSGSIDVSTASAMAPHPHSPKMRSVKLNGSGDFQNSHGLPKTGHGSPYIGHGSHSSGGHGSPNTEYGSPNIGRGSPKIGYGSPSIGHGLTNTPQGSAFERSASIKSSVSQANDRKTEQYRQDTKSSALRTRERPLNRSVSSSRRSSRSSGDSGDITGTATGGSEERKFIRPTELTMHSKSTIASMLKKKGGVGVGNSKESSNWRQNSTASNGPGRQQHKLQHTRRQSRSPDVLVDVHISGSLVGTIEAREGDIAQDLASAFVRRHKLSHTHIPRLATLVCERLDELYEQESDRARIAKLEQLAWTDQLASGVPTSSNRYQQHGEISTKGNGSINGGTRRNGYNGAGNGSINGAGDVYVGGNGSISRGNGSFHGGNGSNSDRAGNGYINGGRKESIRGGNGSISGGRAGNGYINGVDGGGSEVIGRVRIQLPDNNTGLMTVCEGDDVGQLARRFCVSHGLTVSHAKEIEARVLRQMRNGIAGGAGNIGATRTGAHNEVSTGKEEGASQLTAKQQLLLRKTLGTQAKRNDAQAIGEEKESIGGNESASVSKQQISPVSAGVSTVRPLFNLDVDIGQGRNERLVVFAHDLPRDIAMKFVQKHQLDLAKVEKLQTLVETNVRLHYQRQKEKNQGGVVTAPMPEST